MKRFRIHVLQIFILILLSLCGCSNTDDNTVVEYKSTTTVPKLTVKDVPEFDNEPYVVINDNIPYFDEDEYTTDTFEEYSSLDSLGRCGMVYANICREIMPTEERGAIGQIKPSGWKTQKYDIVDGKYLYNRCHLIGYQLSGENANELNLITGTRYMNVEGMLPFEDMVADYVKETDNHVLYRVTPIYEGENLVASGVQMEAFSVEDKGDGICFNVYVYNSQPGITINYANGNSSLSGDLSFAENETTGKHPDENETDESDGKTDDDNNNQSAADYIVNKNTKKFHYPTCGSVKQMNEENKIEFSGDRDDLLSEGYDPCGNCRP